MTPLAQYFELKDPERSSFILAPERDYDIFVDLDDVWKGLEDSKFNIPHRVIEGDFGTGTTHLLRRIEAHSSRWGWRSVYLQLGATGPKMGFFAVYSLLMEALLQNLERELLEAAVRRPDRLKDQLEGIQDLDLRRAFRDLFDKKMMSSRDDYEEQVIARRWLKGVELTASQAGKRGYEQRLGQSISPVKLSNHLQTFGNLYKALTDHTVVLLIDESEVFSRVVDENAQASIGNGIRHLMDPDNNRLGIILGLNLPSNRKGLHPMRPYDVESRIKYVSLLQPLSSRERIRKFVEVLWKQLALRPDDVRAFRLSSEAFDLLLDRLERWRSKLMPSRELELRLPKTPSQRDLINVLDAIGEAAVRKKVPASISAQMLLTWFDEVI